jgi:N-acetylmuramoyl-L-alanine amidase
MKTFINKIKFIVPCIALLGFMSCNNDEFLENETKTVLTDDTQWANGTNADIFINDIYNAIPRYSTNGEQLDYYSDDYNSSYYYTSHNFRQGIEIAPGGSTGNPWFGTHGPTNGYEWRFSRR